MPLAPATSGSHSFGLCALARRMPTTCSIEQCTREPAFIASHENGGRLSTHQALVPTAPPTRILDESLLRRQIGPSLAQQTAG